MDEQVKPPRDGNSESNGAPVAPSVAAALISVEVPASRTLGSQNVDKGPTEGVALAAVDAHEKQEDDPDKEREDDEDDEDESTDAATDPDSTISVARLLRDSAFLIAAVTALLYLTSHVYASQYLGVFQVGAGFDGGGLGNLAMIPMALYLIMLMFAAGMYGLLAVHKTWVLLVGSAAILGVGVARPAYVWAYDVALGAQDYLPAILSVVVMLSVVLVHVSIRRLTVKHAKKTAERKKRRLAAVEAARKAREAEAEAVPPSERPAYWQKRLEGTTAALAKSKRGLRRASRRLMIAEWQLRATMLVSAGYFTAMLALPTAAFLDAAGASKTKKWAPTEAKGIARTPVYWVGDRVVYLTTEDGTCFVSMQIDNAIQAKAECSDFVSAIKPASPAPSPILP